jgi:hypothetical protein
MTIHKYQTKSVRYYGKLTTCGRKYTYGKSVVGLPKALSNYKNSKYNT